MLDAVSDDARVPRVERGLVDIDTHKTYRMTQGLTQPLLALADASSKRKSEQAKAAVSVDCLKLVDTLHSPLLLPER